MTDDLIIKLILVLLNCISFGIGLIIGKIWHTSGEYGYNDKPKSFLKHNNNSDKIKVSIDDATYVTDIRTSGMEKKYDNLGEVKQSQDNISLSVNKLKNLKG